MNDSKTLGSANASSKGTYSVKIPAQKKALLLPSRPKTVRAMLAAELQQKSLSINQRRR
ncbi:MULTISPECIES: hypothetical protein [Priestia]|uniref:hypothetical protein n=1 Tax=Priestia TaxID=2800373 RepID=UPI00203BF85D|nr:MULTISPECIES: hypothetical protein [Priestia]MCM3770459.1 hypothetical protein [Priestia aryabhattai]MDY0940825.1 hypothetical protein [Priestia megaterium]